MKTSKVTEIISFKLVDGISDDAFLDTVNLTNTFLDSCNGFISRRLSKGDDGQWLDHIEWHSMDEARSASERFMQDKTLMPFMEKIENSTVSMRHNQLLLSKN